MESHKTTTQSSQEERIRFLEAQLELSNKAKSELESKLQDQEQQSLEEQIKLLEQLQELGARLEKHEQLREQTTTHLQKALHKSSSQDRLITNLHRSLSVKGKDSIDAKDFTFLNNELLRIMAENETLRINLTNVTQDPSYVTTSQASQPGNEILMTMISVQMETNKKVTEKNAVLEATIKQLQDKLTKLQGLYDKINRSNSPRLPLSPSPTSGSGRLSPSSRTGLFKFPDVQADNSGNSASSSSAPTFTASSSNQS